MKIIEDLKSASPTPPHMALTIGNFDGVHLGHRAILEKISAYATAHRSQAAVVTFKNHPSDILRPHQKVLQICSLEHKIALLEDAGIHLLILLGFTKFLSQQTAEEFLQTIRASLPFSYLVLGHDATLGRDRHGDRRLLEQISTNQGFKIEYLEEQTIHGERISSTKIRQFITEGNLTHASTLLGRDYSIYGKVSTGKKVGRTLGFPTANIAVDNLLLPPLGVYAVRVKVGNALVPGVANLGFAPTLRKDKIPTLEVFLFDTSIDLYNQSIEVFFFDYLRPEMQFETLQALQAQIQNDIAQAKTLL